MTLITLKSDTMYRFFAEFDVIEHKFFYQAANNKNRELVYTLFKKYQNKSPQKYWNIRQATDTFLTLEKLYNTDTEDSIHFCNLLEKITTDLLGSYVNIDGIQELFQASYFYFEWMMHLEYKEQEHNYSYYRDHYLHQIRNLYEMFIFLDDLDMWHSCMELYKNKSNSTASWIQNSIQSQIASLPTEEKKLLTSIDRTKNSKVFLEEFFYHYLFEAVAIVSALVHDIGYPIAYTQRTVNKLQHFLPLSYLFVNSEDQIPKISSVLKSSLLFEVIGEKELEKRLLEHDHGAYSAIILLFHYYDNGHIFHLPPLKRMVIELSALVIYNHTLKYHFQNKKKACRYQNIYSENPLSYLFRLCDDLQEWERVYFDISMESNFFICPDCKMPMIRNLQKTAAHRGEIPYQCFCKTGGINTNLFSYRRLINAAPFKSLSIQAISDKKALLKLGLHCELRTLLQMAKYNPRFAVQRVKGVLELKEMLKDQVDFPPTYINTFISCNPIAIKAEILRKFICHTFMQNSLFDSINNRNNCLFLPLPDDIVKNDNNLDAFVKELYRFFTQNVSVERVWKKFVRYAAVVSKRKKSDWISGWDVGEKSGCTIKETLLESLTFYVFLIILGEKIRKKREYIISLRGFETNHLSEQLFDYFSYIADSVGKACHIYDSCSLALIADYLQQVFCRMDALTFEQPQYQMLYYHYLTTPVDMVDTVKTYIKNDMYQKICYSKCRKQKNGEMLFDYYSDYYFFFVMDELSSKSENS